MLFRTYSYVNYVVCTVGYDIVKNVSRFCIRFASTPISGLRIETEGNGVSVVCTLTFLCSLSLLYEIKKKLKYISFLFPKFYYFLV